MSKKRNHDSEGAGASGGGKKAKADVLPEPLTLPRRSKSLKSAFGDVEALNLFEESPRRLERLSEDRKAVGKYGWHTVRSVGAHVSSLPGSLTDSQRLNFLEMACPGEEKETLSELCTFLAEQCIYFVGTLAIAASDVVQVHAPPVTECVECGSWLVSYHSCDVKLYTLQGVKCVSKVSFTVSLAS